MGKNAQGAKNATAGEKSTKKKGKKAESISLGEAVQAASKNQQYNQNKSKSEDVVAKGLDDQIAGTRNSTPHHDVLPKSNSI